MTSTRANTPETVLEMAPTSGTADHGQLVRERAALLGYEGLETERETQAVELGRRAAANGVQDVVDDLGDGPLTASIFEDAVEGGEFLERVGLERSDNDHLEIGGLELPVIEFGEGPGTAETNEPSVVVPETVPVGGADRMVDREEPIPGGDAPFFRVFADRDATEASGYFCS